MVCPDCGALITAPVTKSWAAVSTVPPIPQGMSDSLIEDSELRTCPACGERTLRAETHCRCCAPSSRRKPPPSPNDRAAAEVKRTVPLTTTVRHQQFSSRGLATAKAEGRLGLEDQMDGIPGNLAGSALT